MNDKGLERLYNDMKYNHLDAVKRSLALICYEQAIADIKNILDDCFFNESCKLKKIKQTISILEGEDE